MTDLLVHQRDLVVSTQGRAFWIVDDLTPLHAMAAEQVEVARGAKVQPSPGWLFAPRPGYRSGTRGVTIDYHLAEAPKDPVKIEILDAKNTAIATLLERAAP